MAAPVGAGRGFVPDSDDSDVPPNVAHWQYAPSDSCTRSMVRIGYNSIGCQLPTELKANISVGNGHC